MMMIIKATQNLSHNFHESITVDKKKLITSIKLPLNFLNFILRLIEQDGLHQVFAKVTYKYRDKLGKYRH